jgi:hypothetical protein
MDKSPVTAASAMLAATTLLFACIHASAGSELERFRLEAAKLLLDRALIHRAVYGADHRVYLCFEMDGKPLSDALASYVQSKLTAGFGGPNDCVMVGEPEQQRLVRKGTDTPACSISLENFQFHAYSNASASSFTSCGWPDCGGETIQFEMCDGMWRVRDDGPISTVTC